jgi:phage replication-related protein YjqB (UPF0714/DUF867 family)
MIKKKREDKYASLKELKANETEGVDYRIFKRVGLTKPDVAIIAPHGGGIEPGTSEIANQIAEKQYSFFTLEGTKPKGNFDLHVKSSNYYELECLELLKQADIVIAIHGCDIDDVKDEDKIFVYLGGKNSVLRDKIRNNLKSLNFDIGDTPNHIEGKDDENICNKGKSEEGVQIEIQSGLRSSMFEGNYKTKAGRANPTSAFFEFVSAIKKSIDEYRLETFNKK